MRSIEKKIFWCTWIYYTHGDSTPLSISKNTHPRTTTYRILDNSQEPWDCICIQKTILYIMLRKILGASLQQIKEKQISLESVIPQIDTLLTKGVNPGVRFIQVKKAQKIGPRPIFMNT